MFMTSGESAIVQSPSAESGPCHHVPGQTLGEIFPERATQLCVRVNLGVLSIYQPGKTEGQAEFPSFLGFCGCFLEITLGTIA